MKPRITYFPSGESHGNSSGVSVDRFKNPPSTPNADSEYGRPSWETTANPAHGLFEATVECAPVAIAAINSSGMIVMVNAETEKIFGYERHELLGRPIEVLVPARYRSGHPASRDAYCTCPEARRMGSGRDLTGLRRDGSEFPVEIGLNPIETEHGLFVISTIADITDRKDVEAQKERSAAALARSNADLEQFAYIASHDLQEPLRKISSYCQLIKEEQGGRLDDEGRGFLEVAITSAQRLSTLIRDMLAFSRLATGGEPLTATSSSECAAQAIEQLEVPIRESSAEIHVGNLPRVLAEPSQLVLLFQNLIANAIRYRSAAPPVIVISCRIDGGSCEFAVADNGIGIDPQYHERIFQLFQRLHNRRKYEGTGIGLALCRRIVERMGGKIRVDSALNRGATFFFTAECIPNEYRPDDETCLP